MANDSPLDRAAGEAALDRELWRLALAEHWVAAPRGMHARPDYSPEMYLAAHPELLRMRERCIADGTCWEAARDVQTKRLELLAKHERTRAPEPEPTEDNWLTPFMAPGVTVQFTDLIATDIEPSIPEPPTSSPPALEPPTIDNELAAASKTTTRTKKDDVREYVAANYPRGTPHGTIKIIARAVGCDSSTVRRALGLKK